ncbi:MAG: HAMP domain-containing sensor histidine kinase [Thermomicrobiales bacterium]
MTSGRRRPHVSTRTRLTVWYAALLMILLLALGYSVSELTRNRLETDVDSRLINTARDIGAGIEGRLADLPFTVRRVSFADIIPVFGSFASRGLLIQVVSPDSELIRGSEYAPDTPLVPPGNDPAGAPTFITTTANGEQVRAVRYPLVVTDANGVRWYLGAVIVGERLTTLHETMASLQQVLLVASIVGLTFAIAGGWMMAGRALRPVDRVTAAAATIAAGDGTATSLAARLPVPPTNDELSRLSATFNAMLNRLEASFRTQERFVADASHELRTPLTAIRGNVDVLLRQLRGPHGAIHPDDLEDSLVDIRRESDRMRRLLDDLLTLARSDSIAGALKSENAGPVRLDEIAAEAVRSAQVLANGQEIELEAPRGVEVRGDYDRLHQLLMILLDNAIRHTPAGGRIRVAVAATEDGAALLAVRDEGEGIAPEHLPHLFERFYRADGARGRSSGGTGLGLAIAHAICEAHKGKISVTSTPGQGTTFLVVLPNAVRLGGNSRPQPMAVPGVATDGHSHDYRSRTSAAPSPPMNSTNRIGISKPATDSLRNPRP